MKSVISIIGLISSIEAGFGGGSTDCAAIQCPNPSECIDGIGCVSICGTIAGLTCSSGQECVDDPTDNCELGVDSDCQGFCVDSSNNCEENQMYRDCGSPCPQSCDNMYPQCIFLCVEGCFCKPGYVLNDVGECILKSDCPNEPTETDEPFILKSTEDPTMCYGDYEEYDECGSYCPETCSPSNGFIACPAVCVPGCECMDGYVRDDWWNCVPRDECPTTAAPVCDGDNQEYNDCGSYCRKSCANLDYFDQIVCPAVCVEGCFCKDGYVRDWEGYCILEDDCPTYTTESALQCPTIDCPDEKPYCVEDDGSGQAACVAAGDDCDVCYPWGAPCYTCPDGVNYGGACGGCTWQETWHGAVKCRDTYLECPYTTDEPWIWTTEDHDCGENEWYNRCGTECPPTCDDWHKICNFGCVETCECKYGYILDEEDGECVPWDECDGFKSTEDNKECGVYEEWTDCNGHCRPNCDSEDPFFCTAVCIPGCNCIDGYILDEEYGECIPEDECPPSATDDGCGENEVFTQCNGHCRPTCETGLDIICTRQCEAGCNCKDGYILDEYDGECIPIKDCPDIEPSSTEPFKGNDANSYGLMMVFGVIVSVFGWM